jgi:pyridoxine 5-phosphate synthase
LSLNPFIKNMQSESIRLGVNIDHAATLRQARYRGYERLRGEMVEPDPMALALLAQQAGADGITVHPREDGRHIQRGDVELLKEVLQVPLNMEMACTSEMLDFALQVLPHTVCLVPEKREEVSTEGGLDVLAREDAVRRMVAVLGEAGVQTSLFIDPDPEQISAAARTGARYVELHTGAFANAYYSPDGEREAERIESGATCAREAGLIVNLGHGINYTNIMRMRTIPNIYEMNIGHSILSRALFCGIEVAVREMKRLMNPALT